MLIDADVGGVDGSMPEAVKLPVCKYRETINADWIICRSPKMTGEPDKRRPCSSRFCEKCSLADADGPRVLPSSEAGINRSAMRVNLVKQEAPRAQCVHEENIITYCHTCRGQVAELRHVRGCAVHDRCVRDRDAGKTVSSIASCKHCPDYSDGASVGSRIPLPMVMPYPGAVGVVVGCYGWPKLAELQVKLIRGTCGMIPILIADDGSPQTGDFARMCERYEDVTFAGSLKRLGHYAGDASVFRKGLEWAKARGFQVLVKLSQRMLLTAPGWILGVVDGILKGDVDTIVSECIDSGVSLHVRSEAMAMRVSAWAVPEVLDRLSSERLTQPAELLINHIATVVLGGRRSPWNGLTKYRGQPSPGFVWHCCNSKNDYEKVASSFGVRLDDDFSIAGRQRLPNWKKG